MDDLVTRLHRLLAPPAGTRTAATNAVPQVPKSFVARNRNAGPNCSRTIFFQDTAFFAFWRRHSSAIIAALFACRHGLFPRQVGLNKRIRAGSRPIRRSASSHEPK